MDLNSLFNSHATESSLAENDLSYTSLVALLFQTGYLTIKGYETGRRRYKLGIPNKEVSEGLFEDLMKVCQYKDTSKGLDIIYNMSDDLTAGNPEQALKEMQSYLGSIGYPQGHADKEFAFQNNLLIPLKLLGMDVEGEVYTSSGRIDMVVKTDGNIYIFEFKLDKSAEDALRQIEEKDYSLPYETDSRKVYKIGVNFSSEKRNIDSWSIS